jgi:hypothetical protein
MFVDTDFLLVEICRAARTPVCGGLVFLAWIFYLVQRSFSGFFRRWGVVSVVCFQRRV